jgi:hypothetical protein
MHHKGYNTKFTSQEDIKPCRRRGLGGWSERYYLTMCRRARSTMSDQMTVYVKPASSKEHQNEGVERR